MKRENRLNKKITASGETAATIKQFAREFPRENLATGQYFLRSVFFSVLVATFSINLANQ